MQDLEVDLRKQSLCLFSGMTHIDIWDEEAESEGAGAKTVAEELAERAGPGREQGVIDGFHDVSEFSIAQAVLDESGWERHFRIISRC